MSNININIGQAYDQVPFFPHVDLSIQVLGFWFVWLFTVPSLRARKPGASEKVALDIAFLATPVVSFAMPFITKVGSLGDHDCLRCARLVLCCVDRTRRKAKFSPLCCAFMFGPGFSASITRQMFVRGLLRLHLLSLYGVTCGV